MPGGGLQIRFKRDGGYAAWMLGEWALGAIEFAGTAAVVDVLGIVGGVFGVGSRGGVLYLLLIGVG